MSLGLGVLIGYLMGNASSVDAWKASVGKTITDLRIEGNELRFTFADGSRMKLFDNGQSCCEERWMHTDDDLAYHIGASLRDAEVRPGGTAQGEEGETESEFLIVTTSKGAFTVVNYNAHNGYYGGFLIEAAAIEQEGASHE